MAGDVDISRLGSILALTYERLYEDFESLLLLKGLGPKTLRSLTLVSEVIHGSPSRFKDPARFSFAQGGKDGHPYPVQTKVYDETIDQLNNALKRSKIDHSDKKKAFRNLSRVAEQLEQNFTPSSKGYEKFLKKEADESRFFGGQMAYSQSKSTKSNKKRDNNKNPRQLRLFE
jgi:hypothetical protein